MHDDHSEGRVPGPELPQPLAHDSGGADNDAGLEHAAAVEACQEGGQLDGLAQTHLIPNDASCCLCVQLPQPLHPWGSRSATSMSAIRESAGIEPNFPDYLAHVGYDLWTDELSCITSGCCLECEPERCRVCTYMSLAGVGCNFHIKAWLCYFGKCVMQV